MTISSDAHSADAIDCAFDLALSLLREVGYKNVMLFRGGKFVEVAI